MSWSRPPITPEQRREETLARRHAPVQQSAVKPLHRGVMEGAVQPVDQPQRAKIERKVRQNLRDSARGEPCQVRYIGVCCHDPEKTILSHARWGDAGRGKATKAFDLAAAYCCVPCDQAYDGQTRMPAGYTREKLDLEWALGHFRTLVRMAEKGLV